MYPISAIIRTTRTTRTGTNQHKSHKLIQNKHGLARINQQPRLKGRGIKPLNTNKKKENKSVKICLIRENPLKSGIIAAYYFVVSLIPLILKNA